VHLEAICEELEQLERINNTAQVHKYVNRLTKRACPKAKLTWSETGEMLTEDAPILEQWRTYCADLYSKPESERAQVSTPSVSDVGVEMGSYRTGQLNRGDRKGSEVVKAR